jgi:hypothetical protein
MLHSIYQQYSRSSLIHAHHKAGRPASDCTYDISKIRSVGVSGGFAVMINPEGFVSCARVKSIGAELSNHQQEF